MTLHEFPTVEQGSEAWRNLRRGMVTASVVGKLISVEPPDALTVGCPTCHATADGPCLSAARKVPTPMKAVHPGRYIAVNTLPPVYMPANNETSRGITATLVAERVAGFTEDTPMTSDMWRGVECEPIARGVYSSHYQQAVEIGFMVREENGWTLGYSPDGLVADDGLVEIKSPRAKTHLNTILADQVPAFYMPQLQAGLLVSGRNWIDFVSYCGGMPLFVKRVLPDPRWFDAIEASVRNFEKAAEQMTSDYLGAVVGLPMTERINNDLGLRF